MLQKQFNLHTRKIPYNSPKTTIFRADEKTLQAYIIINFKPVF